MEFFCASYHIRNKADDYIKLFSHIYTYRIAAYNKRAISIVLTICQHLVPFKETMPKRNNYNFAVKQNGTVYCIFLTVFFNNSTCVFCRRIHNEGTKDLEACETTTVVAVAHAAAPAT